jgi:hypothetical protein
MKNEIHSPKQWSETIIAFSYLTCADLLIVSKVDPVKNQNPEIYALNYSIFVPKIKKVEI